MRVRLKSGDGTGVNAIAFRAAGQKLGQLSSTTAASQVHAAGTFSLDRWQGEERVQFKLIDIAPRSRSPVTEPITPLFSPPDKAPCGRRWRRGRR